MDGADGVYPASEDTYLLIDALQQQIPFIKQTLPANPLCIEVGCGSGEVSQALTIQLPNSIIFATDVNTKATAKTSTLVQIPKNPTIEVLTTDMFTCFTTRTRFHIIVFNPPYVPTDDEELQRALTKHDIAASWAGGPQGRHIIDNFLRALPSYLAKPGLAYLVLLHENDPQNVAEHASRLGLNPSIVLQRRAGMESLYIMRFHLV